MTDKPVNEIIEEMKAGLAHKKKRAWSVDRGLTLLSIDDVQAIVDSHDALIEALDDISFSCNCEFSDADWRNIRHQEVCAVARARAALKSVKGTGG